MTRKLSTIREIIEENRREGAVTTDQHLEMLIDKFCTAARAVDPAIEHFWVGRDGHDLKRPFFIHMVRKECMGRATG